jgi:hypothetical protein
MGENPANVGQGKAFIGGGTALDEFHSKFAPGAKMRVFGCDIQDPVPSGNHFEIIRSTTLLLLFQAYNKPIRVKKPTTPLEKALRASKTAKPEIDFNLKIACNDEASAEDPEFPGEQLTDLSSDELFILHTKTDPSGKFFQASDVNGVFHRTYDEVIGYVARRTMEIYGFKAADALQAKTGMVGVTVFAGVPSTSADPDNASDETTMSVQNWGRYLNFFENYLGVHHDEPGIKPGLGYGRFDGPAVNSVKQHASDG